MYPNVGLLKSMGVRYVLVSPRFAQISRPIKNEHALAFSPGHDGLGEARGEC